MTTGDLQNLYDNLTADSLPAFIRGIRAVAEDPSAGPVPVSKFLAECIRRNLPEARRICAEGAAMTPEDKANLYLFGKTVAAAMLVHEKAGEADKLRDAVLLFLEMASCVVNTRKNVLGTALDVMSYGIRKTGLEWSYLTGSQTLDIVTCTLLEKIAFDRRSSASFTFTGKGKVVLGDGTLKVFSAEVGDGGSQAFTVGEGRVEVVSRNTRGEKLKETEREDPEAVTAFAESFLAAQQAYAPPRPRVKEHKDGDVVDIKVLGVADGCAMPLCGVVGPGETLEGELNNEELVKGLFTEDIVPYLCQDDCIRGAVLHFDDKGPYFSIADAYTAYARKKAQDDYGRDVYFEARVVAVDGEAQRINWMTPAGYGGITRFLEGDNPGVGDTRVLKVLNVKTEFANTYINLCVPRYDNAPRRFGEDMDVLKDFVSSEKEVLSARGEEAVKPADASSAAMIRSLAAVMVERAPYHPSFEAFRMLNAALFLYRAVGDEAAVEGLRPAVYCLRRKIGFAQGVTVPSAHPVKLPAGEAEILGLLSQWGAGDDGLLRTAAGFEPGSEAASIAGLMLGMAISSEFADEVKADPELVRRRICTILGVGDQYRLNGALRTGKYGKAEGHEVEFKSSYVYRNDNGRPDIDYQGRGQVFEAVCGFLNADGGVLYLGVSDSGDPIVADDYGLNADIAWLGGHYKTINDDRKAKLGHPVNMVKDLDSFVQFLDAEKELYFKESLLGNIIIEETEDADAIRIKVKPAEFEIAYLYSDKTRTDGIAYVRDGGRTVPMKPQQKTQRLASLKRISREMEFIVTIKEAIDKHRKLIFKDYASGSSCRVSDRHVVPVGLYYNDENIYCLDLDTNRAKPEFKQFRIFRIGDIEVLDDTYTVPADVKMPPVDVFRWLYNEKTKESYHVKLKMTVRAKNYLVEEFSCASRLPAEEFYQVREGRDDYWILDTTVFGIGAVRRFYLGLADMITILDTEDSDMLKENFRQFVADAMA